MVSHFVIFEVSRAEGLVGECNNNNTLRCGRFIWRGMITKLRQFHEDFCLVTVRCSHPRGGV